NIMSPLILLVGAQLTFNVSDLMGRYFMSRNSFSLSTFLSLWFAIYMLIRTVATMVELYVFKTFELGKLVTIVSVGSIIFANILGVLVLKEVLPTIAYLGIALAMIAFMLVAFAKQST